MVIGNLAGGRNVPAPAIDKKIARGRLAGAARVEEVAGGRGNFHLSKTTDMTLTRLHIG